VRNVLVIYNVRNGDREQATTGKAWALMVAVDSLTDGTSIRGRKPGGG